MLTYVLPGTPRPLSSDSPECQWLWTSPADKGPPAPWGGPSQVPPKPVTWVPDAGVPTDCFTVELWLRPAQPLASVEHPLITAACNHRGTAWWFGLTRHLRPALRWLDRQGLNQELVGDSLVDLLVPTQWLHLALVHHGQGADPAEVSHDYTQWSLYATPAGEAWPRLVAHDGSARCAMPAASGCVTLHQGAFAYAQAACFKHAKLPCEFPTLGQDPPTGVTLSGDFAGGSARSPVGLGPRRVAVACAPGVTDSNYWFHTRVSVADPGDDTPLDLTIVAAPRGQAMLNTLFRSRDGDRWDRLPGGWFMTDRTHAAQGFLRVRVPVEGRDFYLAASPPYRLADRDRLLADLADNPWV
ncbi:MAG: hypothetical protein HYU66_20430, partial [Armatimonadetes bacterium]|nr:hypothetical protein [Armatimonadota bacterium]